MTKLVAINANGLPLAEERIDGTLWRLTPDGALENVNLIDMLVHDRGLATRILMYDKWGNLRSDGTFVRQHNVLPNEIIRSNPGKIILSIYPRAHAPEYNG